MAQRRSRRRPSTESFQERFETVVDNACKVIKGKEEVVRLAFTALLANGHVLLHDVPGTGKTMLARALARTINAEDNRVQCTPDLLPADVTGSPVLERKSGDFVFRPGPVFTNILLADELNRATPKTQSAFLEAMQERRVTVDGVTYSLPRPFLVLATQNPIELAGTFPLPEAQLDRFMFRLSIGYPDRMSELAVLDENSASDSIDTLEPAIETEEVLEMMTWAAQVSTSEAVKLYIIDLVQATRDDKAIHLGGSTRASLALIKAARVRAAMRGRDDVLPDDVKEIAPAVLAHRIVLRPEAMLRDETVDNVIERCVGSVRVPVPSARSTRATGREDDPRTAPASA